MIVGHNHHRLEKRITTVLLGGMPYPREALFLHRMSERIIHRGQNTWLSDRQAEKLFAILSRCEAKASPTPPRQRALPPVSPPPLPRDWPEPLRLKDCFEKPEAPPKHLSPTTPAPQEASPPPDETEPRTPMPVATRQPDIGGMITRIIARNEALWKRRERIKQRLKSS